MLLISWAWNLNLGLCSGIHLCDTNCNCLCFSNIRILENMQISGNMSGNGFNIFSNMLLLSTDFFFFFKCYSGGLVSSHTWVWNCPHDLLVCSLLLWQPWFTVTSISSINSEAAVACHDWMYLPSPYEILFTACRATTKKNTSVAFSHTYILTFWLHRFRKFGFYQTSHTCVGYMTA